MDTQQLVTSNNIRKKMLSKPNLKYYDDLLVYIRLAPLKAEKAKEEVLMELLEHLIEAQQNGVEAEDVFGKTPKQLADEIIESLPTVKKTSVIPFIVEIIFLLVGVYITTTGIFNLFLKLDYKLHIGSAAISLAVLIGGFLILISILLKLMQKSSFTKSKVPFVLSALAMSIYIFAVAAVVNFIPALGKSFTVTPVIVLVTGIVLLIIYFVIKSNRKKP